MINDYFNLLILFSCPPNDSCNFSKAEGEERRLRVFENRVLRVFGAKRNEVTGEWRKLHN